MEFLGLRLLVFCLLVVSCNVKEGENLTYIKYEIGSSTPLDTMQINTKGNTFSIGEKKLNILFDQTDHRHIQFSSEDCEAIAILKLKVGELSDLECYSVYPVIGERVFVLDIKSFNHDGKDFRVYKLFNEMGNSYLKSSTTFWLDTNVLILIKLGQGEYFELSGFNSDLIKLIKEDLDFSELWPIPPTPPVPKFEEKNQE